MIITTSKASVQFWALRGLIPKMRYTHRGVECWEIDVPPEHPDLMHPDYMQCVIEERLGFPKLLARRMALPLYTAKAGGHFAVARDQGEANLGVPIASCASMLRFALTNPETGACPPLSKITGRGKMLRVLGHGQKNGADRVVYFIDEEHTEIIPLDDATAIFSTKH